MVKEAIWTDEEISILKEDTSRTVKELQTLLPDKSKGQIRYRRILVNGPKLNKSPWTEEEDEIVKKYGLTKSIREIAAMLPNKNHGQTNDRRIKLLGHVSFETRNWTETEIQVLKDNKNKTFGEIAELLNHSKTERQIQLKKTSIYGTVSKKVIWTEEEDEILEKNKNKTYSELKKLLKNKTDTQIRTRKNKKSLRKTELWSEEENNYLLDISSKYKLSFAITEFKKKYKDRTNSSIKSKYYDLGLTEPKEPWPEYIKEMYKPEINGDIEIDNLEFGNIQKEIILTCLKENHEFPKIIKNLYQNHINRSKGKKIECPKCSNKIIYEGNSLKGLFPNIAKFFLKDNGISTDEILYTDKKRYLWKCKFNHITKKSVFAVTHTYLGEGKNKSSYNYKIKEKDEFECSDCGREPFILEDKRFAPYIHPTLNDEKEIKKTRINRTRFEVIWKCPKGENHIWPQTPYNIYRNLKDDPNYTAMDSCHVCINHDVTDDNSLLKKRPDIAKLIDKNIHKDIDLNKVYFQSTAVYHFQCLDFPHHKWPQTLRHMSKIKKFLCPFCGSSYRTSAVIKELLISIKDKLPYLTEQQKWVFFQQSGLLEGNGKYVNFAKAIVTNRFPLGEIDKFIDGKDSLVDKFVENKELTSEDILEIEETEEENLNYQLENTLTDFKKDEEVEKEDITNFPELKSKDFLKALDETIDMLQSDEDSIKYLIVSGKEILWKDVFKREEDAIKEIQVFNGNKYTDKVKEEFLNEYNTAKSFSLPKDYAFKKNGKIAKPNLMQWLVATRVMQNKRIGNFSGTGAGKTLSAVLAANISDSKFIIITCPNAVCEGWEREIKSIFPNTKTSIKGFDDNFKNYSGQKFLILNYEYFQQQDSADKVIDILKLGKTDFIIIDEIHYSKQRTADNISKRKEMIKNLIVEAGDKNDDLKVLGMSATPVINNLYEGKTMIELITGKSYDDLETEPNVPNCMKVYQQLAMLGTRWLPEYNIQFKQNEVEINVDEYLGEIKEKVTKKNVLALEQILTKAKIPTIIKNLDKKTVIYTHLVTGIVDVLREEITKAGYSVAQYTGEDKTGLKEFIEGDADVLIGSSSISTGVDGLQDVCQKIIVNILPWTNAEFEQLKGRVFRQGQTKPVEIVIPVTNLNINGEEKSWCKSRLSRIKFKKTLADAAVDGIIPEENFRTEQQVLDDLMKWIDRLSENKILAFDRKPLVSSLFTQDKKEINKRLRTFGDFSALNRKWNTGKSENTHKRLQKNNEEWVHYHELYREARESWVKTPYKELINYYGKRDGLVIGDFGSGEAKISEALKDKHKVHSFDHVAINEDVIECDITKTPLEDECLDVAIFSLALMGSNFKDYIKEAHRTLKLDGRIHIIESASRFKDLEGFEKSLKQYGFDFITSSEMWKFTHIRGEKSTRPFNEDININF